MQTLAGTEIVDAEDAVRLARGCPMVVQACALAHWVGRDGRPVTASRVLRRADVAPAGSILGVPVPGKVRTAADVPALHRPWSFALGAGLLEVGGTTAVAGPQMQRWSSVDDAEILDAWLAGVRAVCAAESHARHEQSVATLAFAFLEVMAAGDHRRDLDYLWYRLVGLFEQEEDDGADMLVDALARYVDFETGDRFAGLVDLLGQLGAVTGDGTQTAAVTALGRWAVTKARAQRPRRITADLPAHEVVEFLADCVHRCADPWPAVSRWLEPRAAGDAARELLVAAGGVSAAARIGAADVASGLGEKVLAVWREVEHLPQLGPHARAALVHWDQLPHLDPVDELWLAAEDAAAALDGPGPDEALSRAYECAPGKDLEERLAAIADSGHPDAGRVVRTLTDFVASGAARSVDQIFQLKVTLMHCRPPIWRRVLMPAIATLDELHAVVQALFGWDGDHLHAFAVGTKRYSDPFFDLGGFDMGDEFAVRLRDLFTGATKKIHYEYDFGASWRHEIVLEKVRKREPDATYPVCVAFASDSPVEYPEAEYADDPEPFDLAKVNGRLAGLEEDAE